VRAIDEAEAAIVRRIFEEYAAGRAPRAIAKRLNEEGIKSPRGAHWSFSTILGSKKRANGILNNELYRGVLVWNRQRFLKDPSTGRRVSRANPQHDWVRTSAPELRIISDDSWLGVQARLRMRTRQGVAGLAGVRDLHRPRYLLSGMIKCGACGARYIAISQHHWGCAAARNSGTCESRLMVRRDLIERKVIEAIRGLLTNSDFVDEFARSFQAAWAEWQVGRTRQRAELEARRVRLSDGIARAVGALVAGLDSAALRARLTELEGELCVVDAQLLAEPQRRPQADVDPLMLLADQAAKLGELIKAGNDHGADARAAVRALINTVTISGSKQDLCVEVRGSLATLLAAAEGGKPQTKKAPLTGCQFNQQFELVAGVGFEPTTFRL
jgi:site-specific DNA recombinase